MYDLIAIAALIAAIAIIRFLILPRPTQQPAKAQAKRSQKAQDTRTEADKILDALEAGWTTNTRPTRRA